MSHASSRPAPGSREGKSVSGSWDSGSPDLILMNGFLFSVSAAAGDFAWLATHDVSARMRNPSHTSHRLSGLGPFAGIRQVRSAFSAEPVIIPVARTSF